MEEEEEEEEEEAEGGVDSKNANTLLKSTYRYLQNTARMNGRWFFPPTRYMAIFDRNRNAPWLLLALFGEKNSSYNKIQKMPKQ
jgi:hypothetical protein